MRSTLSLCCVGPDSALTRLRDHLPSEWKPSLMPEAFHNALGGKGSQVEAEAPTALKSVQNSDFFQYRSGWSWMLGDLQKEEAQPRPSHTMPSRSPFAEIEREGWIKMFKGNENFADPRPNDVSKSSWVLGTQYLNCMDNADTTKMKNSMHFFRPSALYGTFGFVRQPSAEKHQTSETHSPASGEKDEQEQVLVSYSRDAKELRWLIKAVQASAITPLKSGASIAFPVLSIAAAAASGTTNPLAFLAGNVAQVAYVRSPLIMKQLLLRRMNKMDADYLRNTVKPAVAGYCKSLETTPNPGAAGFLQVPVHRSGASAAAGATNRAKMSPAGRGASRVADESSDISDRAEDDEVELEQLTSNLLQHVEKLQQSEEAKNHSPDGVAAGEGSDSTTGREEIEATPPTAFPAVWPTVSTGGAGVGRAWKTRWGGAASRKKGDDNYPQQEPEPSKDLLASAGDVIESDHEEAIEEN